MVPKITVVEAINSPSNFQCVSGIHYVLRDLFKQFLPTHDTEDFQWLLEIANNPTVMQISCTSPTARCIRQCIFMILTSGKHEQNDEILNFLLQNRNVTLFIAHVMYMYIIYLLSFRVRKCKHLELTLQDAKKMIQALNMYRYTISNALCYIQR